MEGKKIYFVSDVHLGLNIADPQEREQRFIDFLHSIEPQEVSDLYLLGDIWDFWYEYRDVIPRCGVRVVAAMISLMDKGIKIHFCSGNHDIWTYSFFESIGIHRFEQPYFTQIGGKTFCLGHGDALGGAKWSYRFMLKIFHSPALQWLFSLLHPWLAYRFALGWSGSNRRSHKPYTFIKENEPLYKYAVDTAEKRKVDYFIFGHFHDKVDLTLPQGERFVVLKDWMDGGMPYGCFDGEKFELK